MEFALEMLIKAELYKLRITEVPTTLSPDGRDRKPHLKTYRDGWRSLRLYLMMSPRWSFGIPGILLSAAGLAATAAGSLPILDARLGMWLMIFGPTLLVLGYQAIMLAVFTKLIALEVGLHPPSVRLKSLHSVATLERFLVFGVLFAACAVVFALILVPAAAERANPNALLKASVGAITLLILSGQTMMSGLCIGVLRLVTERRKFRRKRESDFSDDDSNAK